jgi:hypothetical protein
MELAERAGRLYNGLGEVVEIEDTCLFPMYKGSQVAAGTVSRPERWMIVPQRTVSEDTLALRETAPKTWRYLQKHGDRIDRRASSIYKGRPRFAVFGVGDYTFCEWKVAVSGLYKRPRFVAIGPSNGKPIVFDDTCCVLPCETESQAATMEELLNSTVAMSALASRIFEDSKRPVTIDVLNQLNIRAIAEELGWTSERIEELPGCARRQAVLFQ